MIRRSINEIFWTDCILTKLSKDMGSTQWVPSDLRWTSENYKTSDPKSNEWKRKTWKRKKLLSGMTTLLINHHLDSSLLSEKWRKTNLQLFLHDDKHHISHWFIINLECDIVWFWNFHRFFLLNQNKTHQLWVALRMITKDYTHLALKTNSE